MSELSYDFTQNPKKVDIDNLLDPDNPFNANLELQGFKFTKKNKELSLKLDLPQTGAFMAQNGDHGNFTTKKLLKECDSTQAKDDDKYVNTIKRIVVSYINKKGKYTEDAVTINENTKLTYKNGTLSYKDSLTGYNTQDKISDKIEDFDEAGNSCFLDNFPEKFRRSEAQLTLETFTTEDAKELHQTLKSEEKNNSGSERSTASLRVTDRSGATLLDLRNKPLSRSLGTYTLFNAFPQVFPGVTYGASATLNPSMSVNVRGPRPRWFQKHHYLQLHRYSINATLGLNFGINAGVKTTNRALNSRYSYTGNLAEAYRSFYAKPPFFLTGRIGADAGFNLDLNRNSDSGLCSVGAFGVSLCGRPKQRDLTFSANYAPSVHLSGSIRGLRTQFRGNRLNFRGPSRDAITGTELGFNLTPYVGITADATARLPFFGTKNVLSFGPRVEFPAEFKVIDGADTDFSLNMQLVGQATVLKFLRGGFSYRTPTLTLAEIV